MTTMLDWWHMDGYGFYIWSSYGMLAAAVIVEIIAVRRRRAAARRLARQMRADLTSAA